MGDEIQSGEPNELLSIEEAARLLEVVPDRINIMIEEGLLVPADTAGEPRFPRGEVLAARELGG
jgi:hypothetical protein